MDVRCPACSVEYEFDDDKVTPVGVTVKCTSCGHVFKVRKEAPPPVTTSAPSEPGPGEVWRIRQKDGRTFEFKELTTLQKWIVEQKVSRDDEISKTGQSWKPLGEIAELASFFQVVDAATAAQQMAAQGPGFPPGSYPPGYAPPGYGTGGSYPPGSYPPGYGPPGYGSAPPGYGPGGSYPPGVYPPAGAPPGAEAGARPTPETLPDNPGPSDVDASLDEDDPVLQWKRRGRALRVSALLVVLLLAAGAGVFFLLPELVQPVLDELGLKMPGEKEAPDPAVVEAERALKAGDVAAAAGALGALEPALARGEASALAVASRLQTMQARRVLDGLLLRRALDQVDEEEARKRTAAAEATLQRAYQLAGRALAAGAGPQAALANADYQAQRGALSEMEADLQSAGQSAGPDDEQLRREVAVVRAVGRALAWRRAAPDAREAAASAFETASQDLALSSGDPRARWAGLLAGAIVGELSDEDRPALIELKDDPAFAEMAEMLLAALDEGELDPSLTAPAASEKGEPESADEEGAAAEEEGDPADKGANDDEADDGRGRGPGYGALVAKAKRLQMAGRSRRAKSLYAKAADLRPGDPRPYIGIGWANLDMGRVDASIAAFRRALAKDRGAAEAHLGLGEAYRADDDAAKARTHFERYLDLAPDGPEAPVARRALKQLE